MYSDLRGQRAYRWSSKSLALLEKLDQVWCLQASLKLWPSSWVCWVTLVWFCDCILLIRGPDCHASRPSVLSLCRWSNFHRFPATNLLFCQFNVFGCAKGWGQLAMSLFGLLCVLRVALCYSVLFCVVFIFSESSLGLLLLHHGPWRSPHAKQFRRISLQICEKPVLAFHPQPICAPCCGQSRKYFLVSHLKSTASAFRCWFLSPGPASAWLSLQMSALASIKSSQCHRFV